MQIKQLKISNFGKFRDQEFELSGTSAVFFGQNEAGKSTIVAFINQVLFGFAKKNAKNFDNYQFEANPTVYGGSLTFMDEETTWVVERFQAKNSVTGNQRVWQNGAEVDPVLFFKRLKNIDQNFFAATFLFDQTTLGQIFSLDQNEIVAQINHLGASNSAELMQLSAKLEKDAAQIYKPRAQKLLLNQNLSQLTELEEVAAQNNNQAKEYLALEREAEPLKEELAEKKVANEKINSEIRKNQQTFDKVGILTEYQQVQAEVQPINFDAVAYDKVTKLNDELRAINTQKEQLKQSSNEMQESLENSSLSEARQVVADWPETKHLNQTNNDLSTQIKSEQASLEQVFTYQPDLRQVNELASSEIEQLRRDYQEIKLQQDNVMQAESAASAVAEQKPDKSTTNSVKSILGVGAIVLLVGIILVAIGKGVIGGVAVGIGVLALGYSFYVKYKASDVQSQSEPTPANELESAKVSLADLRNQFKQRYQFEVPTDLNSLLVQASTTNDKLSHIKLIQKQADSNQGIIDQFLDRLAALILPKELELDDWDAIEKEVKSLNERITANDELQNKLAANQDLLANLVQSSSTKQAEINSILEQNNVESVAQFAEVAVEARKQKSLQEKAASLKSMIGADFDNLISANFDREQVSQKLEQLKQQQAELGNAVGILQQKLADLNSQQKLLGDDKAAIKAAAAVADKKAEIEAQVVEWLSTKMSADWINSMLNLASQNRFPKMAVASQKYLNILSGGKYDVLEIADKITIKNSTENRKLTASQLSRGTSEQLYFALKLAFIEQIEDEINLPILIDDAFVNFDDKRVQYMKQLLEELGQKHQILVFTARADVANLFSKSQMVEL